MSGDAPTRPAVRATVRFSRRVRRMRLVVRPGRGAELVAPSGTPVERLQEFLDAHAAWAARTMERLAVRDGGRLVPDEVVLPAIDEHWRLCYAAAAQDDAAGRHRLAVAGEGLLRVTHGGATPDAPTVHALLRGFLLRRGRQVLPGWLTRVREETALPAPARIRVGLQQSLWGSRSHTGTISLSALLLLLPERLVRHVLVHELCHALDMRHQSSFRSLLARHDPAAERHGRELRLAARELPPWSMP